MPAGLGVVVAAVEGREAVEAVEGEIGELHGQRPGRAALEHAAEPVEVVVIGGLLEPVSSVKS
jgi:hypothetical protein